MPGLDVLVSCGAHLASDMPGAFPVTSHCWYASPAAILCQGQELNKTSEIYRHLSDDAFRRVALGQNFFDVAGPGELTWKIFHCKPCPKQKLGRIGVHRPEDLREQAQGR